MKRALTLALLLAACGGDDAAAPDATVCTIPALGDCDGNSLLQCDGDALVTEDCGANLEACVYVDDATGFGCVDLCAQAGITAPRCADGAVESCGTQDGHHVVISEACDVGMTCLEGATATCQADPCAGIGPQGRCAGDTLTECAAGVATDTDCTGAGQVCAYVNDTSGYGCVAPGTGGALVVSGIVRYEDRAPLTSGGLAALAPRPARGAQVSVLAGNTVLATGVAADDGSYVLHYDATLGDQVHVLASAQSLLPARPIRVRGNSTQIHGFGGADFSAAAATTFDLLVTDASGTSEAFNILDQMILAMDQVRAVYDDPTPTALIVRWYRGSGDGTYYGSNQIHLLGESSDDDGYDDTVILHEFGHFVEDSEGRSDNPGGGHDGSPDDPNLAWSEGFSTYFAMATRGLPVYMDSNSGGGWGWDGDDSVTETPNPTGALDQLVSEDMICEDLWDLGDGGTGDDDVMTSGGHAAVLRVEAYLRTAALRTVGQPGVDLVDGLDAWFVQNGLSSCGPVEGVATGVRKFPYDYAGPGGTCP